MQHTLTAVALALIAALLAAIFAPMAISWSQHKQWISAQLAEQSGLKVALDGVIDVTLLPTPSLRAGKVRFSDAENSVQVSAKDFTANLSLQALLRGKIILQDLRLDRAEVRLDADGLEKIGERVPAAGISNLRLSNADVIVTRSGRPIFAVNDLTVQGSASTSLVKLDGSWQRSGIWERGGLLVSREGESTIVKLRSSDEAGKAQWELAGRVAADGQIDGTMRAEWAATLPVVVNGPVTLSKSEFFAPKLEGRVGSDAKGASFTAALRGAWDAAAPAQLLVNVPFLDVDMLAAESGGVMARLEALKAALPVFGFGTRPVKGGFDLAALRLGGQMVSDVKTDFALANDVLALPRLTLKAPFGATMTVSEASLASDGAGKALMNVAAPDLAQLMAWFEDRAATQAQPLTDSANLSGRLAWTAQTLTVDDLRYHSVAGDAAGRLHLGWPEGKPATIMLDVAGESFDLESLRPLLADFSARDASVALSLKQASARGVMARNVAVDLTLKDRLLTLKRLAAQGFAGADFDVKGSLDLQGLAQGQGISGHIVLRDAAALHSLLHLGEGWRKLLPVLEAALPFDGTAIIDKAAVSAKGRSPLGDTLLTLKGATQSGFDEAVLQLVHERPDQLLALFQPVLKQPLAPVQKRSVLDLRFDKTGQQNIRLALSDQAVAQVALGPTGGTVTLDGPDVAQLAVLAGLPGEFLPRGFTLSGPLTWQPKGWTLTLANKDGANLTLSEQDGVRQAAATVTEIDAEALAGLVLGEGALAASADGSLSQLPLVWPQLLDVRNITLSAPKLATPYGRFDNAKARLTTSGSERRLEGSAQGLNFAFRLDRGAGAVGLEAELAQKMTMMQWNLKAAGRGVSARSLAESLAGDGQMTLDPLRLAGLHPDAVRSVTRMAEQRLDAHKPMSEAEVEGALKAQLAPQLTWGKVVLPLRIAGTDVKALPVVIKQEAGTLQLEGRFSALSGVGELSGTLTTPSIAGSDTLPQLPFTASFSPSHFTAMPALDDAMQWLGLRLVERELARIENEERDRVEREKFRAIEKNARPPAPVPAPAPPPTAAPTVAPAPSPEPAKPQPRFEERMRRAIEKQAHPPTEEAPAGAPLNILPVP